MSKRDYYCGPTSDITENGIPAVCTTQDSYSTNTWAASSPGEISWLATLEGADISGTFLTSWAKKTKAQIQASLSNPDEGFYDPDLADITP